MVFWNHLEGRHFNDPESFLWPGAGRTAQAGQLASRLPAAGQPLCGMPAAGQARRPPACRRMRPYVCVRPQAAVCVGWVCMCVWSRGGMGPPPPPEHFLF